MNYLPKNPVLQFNPDTLDHIRKLYNLDNPARLEQAIQILEDWAKKQNHFTVKKFDRAYLERALVVTKGSVEKAKSQIDHMCTFRTLLPKYFIHSNLREELKDILDISWAVPLPKMTKDHHRVYIIKVINSNFQSHQFADYCRWNIINCEYIKSHDYIKGIIVLLDLKNLNLFEVTSKISLTELQEIMNIVVKGFGARLVDIHVINESKIMDFLLLFARQFLSEKLVSRVKLHHDLESVHKYVDPSVLPVELGGTERPLNTIRDEWIDHLSSEDHIKYVKRMNEARTDETQRLEEKFNSLYIGTPGSFRNLIVD